MNKEHSLKLINDLLHQGIINQGEFDKAQLYFDLSSQLFKTPQESLDWLINNRIISRERQDEVCQAFLQLEQTHQSTKSFAIATNAGSGVVADHKNQLRKTGAERIKEREIFSKQIRTFKLKMLACFIIFITLTCFIAFYKGKPSSADYEKAVRLSLLEIELLTEHKKPKGLPFPLPLNKLVTKIKVAGECQFYPTTIYCPITFRFISNLAEPANQEERTLMVKFVKNGKNSIKVESRRQLSADLSRATGEINWYP